MALAQYLDVVEVLRDGKPCSKGERGRLVVTNLRNLATPFIR
jgi:phenylacetate-coenzyme A ligase PaaK-like adenylate-forming protein